MTAHDIGGVVIFAAFISVCLALVFFTIHAALHDSLMGWPWSPLARAERERQRRIAQRASELVERGFNPTSATKVAEREIEREADEMTRALRVEGVEQ